ncbi:MAG: hypothetical protein HQK77_17625 [Desulfobacterales bacterium]|nr:hypothetical protein [Desulfobacterales bacterium]
MQIQHINLKKLPKKRFVFLWIIMMLFLITGSAYARTAEFTVTLSPYDANGDGRWKAQRKSGGSWYDVAAWQIGGAMSYTWTSGSINFRIVFQTVTGWTKPSNISISNSSGGSYPYTRTYTCSNCTYYLDGDGDTYGNPNNTITDPSPPSGYVSNNTDCNDSDAAIKPGAAELCEGIDNDCDGQTDEGCTTYYRDLDTDSYGNNSVTIIASSPQSGYVSDHTDCDDTDQNVNPGHAEVCNNSIDDNCNGEADEGCAQGDLDGDGYTTSGGDCNDANGTVYPGAPEICANSVDDDCDGSTDEGGCITDSDGDRFTGTVDCNDTSAIVNPVTAELCGNAVDEDCSGSDLACDAQCLTISEVPLDVTFDPPKPNIGFLIDDSGSMAWEILYKYSTGDGKFNGNDMLADSGAKNYWPTQYSAHNTIYYNPQVNYIAWPNCSSCPSTPLNLGSIRTNPMSSSNPIDLLSQFTSISSQSIKYAHYYTWNDADNDSTIDNQEIWLVNFPNSSSVDYYKCSFNTSSKLVESLESITIANVPNSVKISRTVTNELQNIALWYTFYRKRTLTVKACIGRVLNTMTEMRIAIRTLHDSSTQDLLDIDTGSNRTTLLSKVYAVGASGGTPLRTELKNLGTYLTGYPSGTPQYFSEANGGSCQQVFSILVTDGYWNGDSPSVGNVDSGSGAPYQDSYSNTLADVAMYFYKNDLSTTLPNLVPTNTLDTAAYQHIVTYGISFGMNGTLNRNNYNIPNCIAGTSPCPTWPSIVNDQSTTIDDLWHATINGRGEFYSAENPDMLVDALNRIKYDIEERTASASSVATNFQELRTDTRIYHATYNTNNWFGDLKAYAIQQSSGQIQDTIWSARDELNIQNWDTGRKIITHNGTSGVPFRYNDLTTTQRSNLFTPNSQTARTELINYLRGDNTTDWAHGGPFRTRSGKLGDIVHSSPKFNNNVIYVGANDGMMHAFNAEDGTEIFAYVPNMIMDQLKYLADRYYNHKFYVDGSIFVRQIGSKAFLVGGLGRGGKGYYFLNITDVSSTSPANETSAASIAKWEYSSVGNNDSDLGYTFSDPIIVKTNTNEWAVVFGNGYDSGTGKAVLYIIGFNETTGAKLWVKKIDTLFGNTSTQCNGLSTPVLIDKNLDGKIDFAYAGDLQGNLWKFDLTATNSASWNVAYGGNAFFRAKNANGEYQPITSKPAIKPNCGGIEGSLIVFGTGKYLESSDINDSQIQTIYGVWDWQDAWNTDPNSKYLGEFQSNRTLSHLTGNLSGIRLLQQTMTSVTQNGHMYRVFSNNTISWYSPDNQTGTHVGWYADLPAGEKIITGPIIRGDTVVAIGIDPSISPCSAGGDSVMYEFLACNGGRHASPAFDITEDNQITSADTVTITEASQTIQAAPSAVVINNQILYAPTILLNQQNVGTELKYFTNSNGTIRTVTEVGPNLGTFYWQVIKE